MLDKLPHRSSRRWSTSSALVRRLATSVTAATLGGALVTGCGFSDATERAYTPAHGANQNPDDADVAVLGAAIVSTKPDSGTLIATVSNKSLDDDVALTAVVGVDEDASVAAARFRPQRAKPGDHIDLSDKGAVKLTGQFAAGDFVRLELDFDNGDRVRINVPVVPNSGHFSSLDSPAPPEPETSEPGTTEQPEEPEE
jgi:hypothetical protein